MSAHEARLAKALEAAVLAVETRETKLRTAGVGRLGQGLSIDEVACIVDAVLATIPQAVMIESPDTISEEAIANLARMAETENVFIFALPAGWRLAEEYVRTREDGSMFVNVPQAWIDA